MAATTMRSRYADFTALQDRADLDMQHRTEARKAIALRSKELASLIRQDGRAILMSSPLEPQARIQKA